VCVFFFDLCGCVKLYAKNNKLHMCWCNFANGDVKMLSSDALNLCVCMQGTKKNWSFFLVSKWVHFTET